MRLLRRYERDVRRRAIDQVLPLHRELLPPRVPGGLPAAERPLRSASRSSSGMLAGNVFATRRPAEAGALLLARAAAEAVRQYRAARSRGSALPGRGKCVTMTQPMNDLRRKLKELLIERLKFEDMTPGRHRGRRAAFRRRPRPRLDRRARDRGDAGERVRHQGEERDRPRATTSARSPRSRTSSKHRARRSATGAGVSWLASLPHQIPFRAASAATRIDDENDRGRVTSARRTTRCRRT